MKIGDIVKFNDKYGISGKNPQKERGVVMVVDSEPWEIGNKQFVKLALIAGYVDCVGESHCRAYIKMRGGWLTDGLEVVE